MKKILALVLTLAMVLSLAACGAGAAPAESAAEAAGSAAASAAEEAAAPAADGAKTVGIAMPTKSLERWNRDGDYLKAQFEAAGYAVELKYSDNDTDQQNNDIQAMIADKVDLLIIAAIDGDSLSQTLADAKSAGIPVIAYDRLIMNTDAVSYYVSFDNYTVGVLQGEFVKNALDLDNAAGPFNIEKMLKSFDEFPMNFLLLGKANSSHPEPLIEQIKAGAVGYKLHEDWGTTPAAIDTALTVADQYDVSVCIHTDSINECGNVENTIKAFGGRTIHTFHSEGAGGGHAPDTMCLTGAPCVIPSTTTPTIPYTVNTYDEHLDMLMVCHHMDSDIPDDIAFGKSRIRKETIAAEDVLHDIGAISIINSDSQAMGRPAEVITRTWQLADKNKKQRGPLPEDSKDNDNFRVKRYIAKYTINPAMAAGVSEYIGSVEVGKVADLVMWRPDMFGVKPEVVIKGGFMIAAKMGDANASIPTPQPIIMKNMFGAYGGAREDTCITFVSQVAYDEGIKERLGLKKVVLPVKGCRTVAKKDMIYNNVAPKIEIDPTTHKVKCDGQEITSEPVSELPMTQLYYLF